MLHHTACPPPPPPRAAPPWLSTLAFEKSMERGGDCGALAPRCSLSRMVMSNFKYGQGLFIFASLLT